MCCRYRFGLDEDMLSEAEKLERIFIQKYPDVKFPSGDIRPSDFCPVLIKGKQKADVELMKWGFTNSHNKTLLINAKSETLLDKQTFKNYAKSNRCVILINGFYEWSHDIKHQKYYFQNNTLHKPLYLAGIFNNENVPNFVVITTKANESMNGIHERMPLILEQNEVLTWLNDDEKIQNILNKKGSLLRKRII